MIRTSACFVQLCGNATVYCPEGSAVPVVVPSGSYSTPEASDASLRDGAAVCPAGMYCVGGVKVCSRRSSQSCCAQALALYRVCGVQTCAIRIVCLCSLTCRSAGTVSSGYLVQHHRPVCSLHPALCSRLHLRGGVYDAGTCTLRISRRTLCAGCVGGGPRAVRVLFLGRSCQRHHTCGYLAVSCPQQQWRRRGVLSLWVRQHGAL